MFNFGRMEVTVNSLDDLLPAARELIRFAPEERIFLFYGEMGAGKTTFIQSICAALGCTEAVTSPTFSIVNEYSCGPGKIYHFDFYRLKKQEEAFDIGCEEYFWSGNYCLIEWPEKIPDLLTPHYVRVDIRVLKDGARILTFTQI